MSFLPQFFSALNTHNIEYSVLRNYQGLPISTRGSDLDILINKEDQKQFITVLLEVTNCCNGKIVSVIESEICPRICLLGSTVNSWGLMIDLHYDEITYRDHVILSNKMIRKNTFLYKSQIYALNPKADAFIGLFKELLNNQKCTPRYYDDFKRLTLEKEFINTVFSDMDKPYLSDFFLKYKQINYSEPVIMAIVARLNNEFPKKNPFLLDHIKKLSRLFKQPGFTIAFLGTDGSGKSTLIEAITPTLSEAFHKAVYYEHMRPNKLPSIARFFGRKEAFTGVVTDPHSSSVSGFWGSMARWAYYMLDYTVGYYLKIYPKKAIRSCVWIFDRYYYDYLIDPKRARINLPSWLLKLGQNLIPEPDMILCLGANPEAIHQRKPELPLVEVKRQVMALRIFCKNHERAVWIDTGQTIEETAKEAMEAIIAKMGKRFEQIDLGK